MLPQTRIIAILLCAIAPPLTAADFHPISSVTSDTAGTDFYPASRLIQGSGVGFDAAEPHNALGTAASFLWVTNAPNGGAGDYFGPTPTPSPRLVFDLGSAVALTEISVWGYADTNKNGITDFDLRFSLTTTFSGAPVSISGVTQPVTARQSFSFPQVTARYVELVPTDNLFGKPGTGAGGDRVGIGEIAFENTVPPNDPDIDIPADVALDLDGSVQTISIPIANNGVAQALTVSIDSLSGTNAAAFTPITVPASIPPGGSDTIDLSFNPAGLSGAISATLTVNSNDVLEPSAAVAMSGFLHDPKLSVAPSFDFGQYPTGSGGGTANLPISNAGGGQTLNISSATISGPGAGSFSVTSFPATLAPLAAGQIDLNFSPSGGDGFYNAVLTINSDDALTPNFMVNLSALVGDVIPGSGLRINEFMAANDTTLDDGDGESSDWIEIYNGGPGPADLSGWHLTDSSGNLDKWEFPPGTSLAEGGFLVVFASGKNVDDYVDPGGNLHTNFKLSSGGEYLALVRPDGSTVVSEFSPTFPAQFTDVAYGTYQNGGSTSNAIAGSDADVLVPSDGSLGTTWTFESFTPGAGWSTGGTGTGVGYDNGSDYDPWIDIDVESIMDGQNPSIYIRVPFNVADTSAVAAMSLNLRYDDGFVAYLNGTEVASRRAPAAPVWNSTTLNNATASEPLGVENIDISAHIGSLLNGDNVLAVHGLNAQPGSSDFLFDPELSISLSGAGPLSLGYLASATPGAPNSGGSANPGPEISAVNHTPTQPTASQDLTVTANIAPRGSPVSSATLHYRTDYGGESTTALLDNGVAPDATAGDGIYTATIPSSTYGVEDMVRWRVTAGDTGGDTGRAPAFLDQTGNNQSAEYFGTVVDEAAASSTAPLFQWFTQNESASHTRSGARASVYFMGRFYDNIFVRQRGGATNGSVSQKFDFNKGDSFYINAEMPSVGEINMNGRGSDSTYVRQTLSFDAHREAGVGSCFSELWEMRVNGGFDRIGVFIEQVDEDFLDRNGYDRDGDLYKMVQRSNLDPVFNDIITGIEKKTNDKTDLTTLGELVTGLNLPTSAGRRAYVIDNLDLPQICNYLAVRSIIQDADDLRKNFYVYRDIHGDDRWRMFPWDKDFTFGVLGDGGTWLPHPFFGDEEHKKQNANQWNVLYDVLFEETTTQRLYLRRLRTLMDTLLQPSGTPLAQRYFENRADDIIDPASPPLSSNVSSIDSYLSSRRTVLENNYPSLIPASQPANPDIDITGAEYNPASGNQDHEYIVLHNNETTEIDISGWCLSGGVDFVFAPGTVIERGGDLYVSPDTLAFRGRPTSPTGGEERLVVGPYSGHLSNFGETVNLKDAADVVVDSYTTPYDPSDAQLYLVISEIMYHPAAPNDDLEFIELLNISDTVTLDLTGVAFTEGIEYGFAGGTMLAPGARVVVGYADFQNGSRLNNGSDRLKLEDGTGSTIHDFSYDDDPPWPTTPDGGGPSLVLIDPGSNPDHSVAANWRPSTTFGGNAGVSDSVPYVGGDLVDYALAAPPALAINTSGEPEFSFGLKLAADEAIVAVETSTNLVDWTTMDGSTVATSHDGAGVLTVTHLFSPAPAGGRWFVRATVSER